MNMALLLANIKSKFYLKNQYRKGELMFTGHMTKMATIPIYDKAFLLPNQWTDFNETWHVALMAKVHVSQCVYKS